MISSGAGRPSSCSQFGAFEERPLASTMKSARSSPVVSRSSLEIVFTPSTRERFLFAMSPVIRTPFDETDVGRACGAVSRTTASSSTRLPCKSLMPCFSRGAHPLARRAAKVPSEIGIERASRNHRLLKSGKQIFQFEAASREEHMNVAALWNAGCARRHPPDNDRDRRSSLSQNGRQGFSPRTSPPCCRRSRSRVVVLVILLTPDAR